MVSLRNLCCTWRWLCVDTFKKPTQKIYGSVRVQSKETWLTATSVPFCQSHFHLLPFFGRISVRQMFSLIKPIKEFPAILNPVSNTVVLSLQPKSIVTRYYFIFSWTFCNFRERNGDILTPNWKRLVKVLASVFAWILTYQCFSKIFLRVQHTQHFARAICKLCHRIRASHMLNFSMPVIKVSIKSLSETYLRTANGLRLSQ
jgi:hypothetical protein